MPSEPYRCEHPRTEDNGHWVARSWTSARGQPREGQRWHCRLCNNESKARRYVAHPREPVAHAITYDADRARAYRRTERGKQRVAAANAAYAARLAASPEGRAKRLEWVHRWQESVGIRVPELQELRRANKRLEQALAYADEREGVRESGELGGDPGPEWWD